MWQYLERHYRQTPQASGVDKNLSQNHGFHLGETFLAQRP